MLTSWLRRAYPTADVQITPARDAGAQRAAGLVDDDGDGVREGFLCDDVNGDLSEFAATLPGQEPATRFYGLVCDADGKFMRGCAASAGASGPGPGGRAPARSPGTPTAPTPTGTAATRSATSYGRKHPGACGETDDDDPPAGGLIGGPSLDHQGIDAGDAALGLPFPLYDWRNGGPTS